MVFFGRRLRCGASDFFNDIGHERSSPNRYSDVAFGAASTAFS